MKYRMILTLLSVGILTLLYGQKANIDYVNLFIGTSNFGVCHPGVVIPGGMASVSPFNVAFDTTGIENPIEKDS